MDLKGKKIAQPSQKEQQEIKLKHYAKEPRRTNLEGSSTPRRLIKLSASATPNVPPYPKHKLLDDNEPIVIEVFD